MSFFGKKFKKVEIENILELLDALKVSESIRAMLRKTDATTTFVKNDDGTIQYLVELGAEKLVSQRVTLGEEQPFTTPDGVETTNRFTLDGDTLTSTMTLPSGRVITFTRTFDGDNLTMVITATDVDIKGSVKYVAV